MLTLRKVKSSINIKTNKKQAPQKGEKCKKNGLVMSCVHYSNCK